MGPPRSLKPLALVLAVAAHEVVGMPPAAGVLTALGKLGLSIGRRDRPRATGGESERHGESEGANHTSRVMAPAGMVKRAGARGQWGGAPQGEAECHITRECGARALSLKSVSSRSSRSPGAWHLHCSLRERQLITERRT